MALLVAVATRRPSTWSPAPPPTQAAIFAVSNVVQAICGRAGPAGAGSAPCRRRGRASRSSGSGLLAVLAACVVASLGGRGRRRPRPGLCWTTGSWEDCWSGGAATPAGCVVVFTTGILALGGLAGLRRPGGRRDAARRTCRAGRSRRAAGRGHRDASTSSSSTGTRRCRWPSRCWCRRSGRGCGSAPSAVALHSLAVCAAVVGVHRWPEQGPFARRGDLERGGAGLPAVHRPGVLPRERCWRSAAASGSR